jgi:Gpi18-like mannosyltransferase
MWTATIIYLVIVIIGMKKCIGIDQKFKKINPKIIICILLLSAFVLRILLAIETRGHGDLGCFALWARRIVEVGAREFYSPDKFTNYPPGYMGILWIVGLLQQLFHTTQGLPFDNVLLKLPAMIFDILTGYFLIQTTRKKIGEKQAIMLGIAYLFAPAVLLNSAIWGQVDSIFTFFLILVLYYLMRGKCEYAYIPFMIGVLLKPQILMFAPVFLLGIVEQVFIKDFSWKKIAKNAWLGISSLLGTVIYLSFFNIQTVIKQYFDTMSSYPFASVNAFNFWAMIGRNFSTQEELVLGIPFVTWGYMGICFAFLLIVSFWIFQIYNKKENNYFLLASIFLFTIFTFSVRMHERYLFPIVILLLFAYVYSKEEGFLHFYLLISLIHFLNVASIYYQPCYYDYNPKDFKMISISAFTVSSYLIFIVWLAFKILKRKKIEKYIKKVE